MDADRLRFTTIAHANHRLCSPISDAKLAHIIEQLRLDRGATVLDLCTGKAELLLQLVERYRTAQATGVDLNGTFLDQALGNVQRRDLQSQIRLLEQDAWSPIDGAPESGWDLVIHIGGAHLHDSQRDTLVALRNMTREGGLILVGDGYWRRDPAPGYLEALGASKDDMPDHAGNVQLGVELGLTPLYTCASSIDEFDHYEGQYLGAMERWLANHADDPSAASFGARIRKWRDSYLRWGRETLGFGIYLYQRPSRA